MIPKIVLKVSLVPRLFPPKERRAWVWGYGFPSRTSITLTIAFLCSLPSNFQLNKNWNSKEQNTGWKQGQFSMLVSFPYHQTGNATTGLWNPQKATRAESVSVQYTNIHCSSIPIPPDWECDHGIDFSLQPNVMSMKSSEEGYKSWICVSSLYQFLCYAWRPF